MNHQVTPWKQTFGRSGFSWCLVEKQPQILQSTKFSTGLPSNTCLTEKNEPLFGLINNTIIIGSAFLCVCVHWFTRIRWKIVLPLANSSQEHAHNPYFFWGKSIVFPPQVIVFSQASVKPTLLQQISYPNAPCMEYLHIFTYIYPKKAQM